MYTLEDTAHCDRCTPRVKGDQPQTDEGKFARRFKAARRVVAKAKGKAKATASATPEPEPRPAPTPQPAPCKTGELYKIPRTGLDLSSEWPEQCVHWPYYDEGMKQFTLGKKKHTGASMLELTEEERRALVVVVLRTNTKAERYGASHQLNWKKVGLSRAYYKKELVHEGSMPTPRAAAAFRFFTQVVGSITEEKDDKGMTIERKIHMNEYYWLALLDQKDRITKKLSLNISSFDLFIVKNGIECAMYPHLYPTTEFSDTGIMETYKWKHKQNDTKDDTNRVVSIGLSWTRKVLSEVRLYGEHRDLPFFLYEKHLAHKYFAAQSLGQRKGVTADVLARDSQTSSGYWEIVQDALADLVRIMLVRCYDEKNYPQLYQHVRNLRGQVWLCAFPNVFITIAPAEWKFPRPYYLEPYANCVFAGAYIMALHM